MKNVSEIHAADRGPLADHLREPAHHGVFLVD